MKKTIKTWKEFWHLYADKENLTEEYFNQLVVETDPLYSVNESKWVDGSYLWKLYNSPEKIKVVFTEDDGINENDFRIVIYDSMFGMFECYVCTPDPEDAPTFLPYMPK